MMVVYNKTNEIFSYVCHNTITLIEPGHGVCSEAFPDIAEALERHNAGFCKGCYGCIQPCGRQEGHK